ncbi:MAG TPA: electron transfer flavoprotein-ubiquinone oxidoreductase [Candidatus Dormibacteraeota bacterium]|nr:electron transfer flavoprotein-ubiquinone oxidoreductase [Candidatus Dormibacteraeota bacterium]
MAERDTLEVDVLFVGAGPASLAGALRLKQLADAHERRAAAGEAESLGELSIMVIDKAGEIGHHGISGAVMDPRALDELLPEWRTLDCPVESEVTGDEVWFLTGSGTIKAPIVPPMLNNHGKYVASLNRVVGWLGGLVEQAGVDVFASFPGQELLYDGDRVAGVRVGDKGVDHEGKPKSNYEPGPDLFAKVTVLGEGPRGSLAKELIARLRLDAGANPQVYAAGVKEIWKCPPGRVKPGHVIHTMGFPLPAETFGGGFIYGMRDDLLDIGFVTGLDYRDPSTDPHDFLQRFKAHPAVKSMLEGAELVRYGAKAIPEGGWWAMPRPYADGVLIVGDSAGFLNPARLKGVHLAMKSGMLAAETAFEALLVKKFDARQLASFQAKIDASWAREELFAARNFHQGFEHGGLFAGMLNIGLGMVTGGRGFGVKDRLENRAGHEYMRKLSELPPDGGAPRGAFDGVVTFDKLTDVFKSGTMHDENQPCHLHVADTAICRDRCTTEYGNPCQHFCPAQVYEPLFERHEDGRVGGRLQINFSNCVHCKTCDIADPYQIITWVPPQGGEGPVYTNM